MNAPLRRGTGPAGGVRRPRRAPALRSASRPSRSARPPTSTGVDALVMPGGEIDDDVQPARLDGSVRPDRRPASADGMPVFGTCAGMILLATRSSTAATDQRSFGVLDITVRRNGYGRQVDSFETDLDVAGRLDAPFHGVFIRAPRVEASGPTSRCSPATTATRCSCARAACWRPASTPSSPTTPGCTQQFVASAIDTEH